MATNIAGTGKVIRQYREPVLSCGKCNCEFFEKITINKFRTTATDLQNGQRDMDTNHRVTLLRCVQCDEHNLPVISYNYLTAVDREIAEELVDILNKRRKKNETNLSPEQKPLES